MKFWNILKVQTFCSISNFWRKFQVFRESESSASYWSVTSRTYGETLWVNKHEIVLSILVIHDFSIIHFVFSIIKQIAMSFDVKT